MMHTSVKKQNAEADVDVERNYSIELIRLVAVILITFTHTRHNLREGDVSYFVIEKLPTYGTAILSIISGYLFYIVSRRKEHLFQRKLRSLAIPYLIANGVVLFLVLLLYLFFGYNSLNRLTFSLEIIAEGIFALHSPPINPPTYFIRDIFIIFSMIALFLQKEIKALFVILPFLVFGSLILRLDVAFLFAIGCCYAMIGQKISYKIQSIISFLLIVFAGLYFPDYLKFPVAFFVFLVFMKLKFTFYNTGRYSYLLHLYHSPIIVISYPVLNLFIENVLLKVVAQIIIAILGAYFLFLLVQKYKFLQVLTGGR